MGRKFKKRKKFEQQLVAIDIVMDSKANDERLDELFRSKLETFETEAGDAVWNKLQQRQQPARKFRVPTRWIAAAVAAGVCLGAGFWLTMDREKVMETAVADSPVKRKDKGETTAEIPALLQKEIPVDVSEDEGGIRSRLPAVREMEVKKEFVASSGKSSDEEYREALPAEAPRQITADSGKRNVPAGEAATRVLVVYVTPAPLVETPEVGQETEEVAQAEVEEQAPVKKKRGLQRFFKQLRNAKTGEKVDWEELGLSPQKAYANVETPAGSRPEGYRIQGEKKGN